MEQVHYLGKGPAVLLMAGVQRTQSPPLGRAQPASSSNPSNHCSLFLLKLEVASWLQRCRMERAGSPLHPRILLPCWGWAVRVLQPCSSLQFLLLGKLLGLRVLSGQMRCVCRKPRQRLCWGSLEVQDPASPVGIHEEVRAGVGAQYTPPFTPTGNSRLTEP